MSGLTIGSLSLTPAFDSGTFDYTASTTNNTNTITATPVDSNSIVEISNGSVVVANGTAAAWAESENIVTIVVTNGDETKTYTIVVTKV